MSIALHGLARNKLEGQNAGENAGTWQIHRLSNIEIAIRNLLTAGGGHATDMKVTVGLDRRTVKWREDRRDVP